MCSNKRVEVNDKNRFYKLKNPALRFYCALCRTPREMIYRKNLSSKNYAQILVLSITLIWLLFPLMNFKSFFLFFVVWSAFELVNKMLYRRELPCPHCAFDPTWYKKDVKLAKRKVREFFAQQEQSLIKNEEEDFSKEALS